MIYTLFKITKMVDLTLSTYSGIQVYEFMGKGVGVMRRKNDDWVNATHILKVANFPKAQRTRILEKQVQTGVHEKIQGGYGKYQGTWVPLEKALELAKDFDVYDDLLPILGEIDHSKYTESTKSAKRKAAAALKAKSLNLSRANSIASGNNLDYSAKRSKTTGTPDVLTDVPTPIAKRGRGRPRSSNTVKKPQTKKRKLKGRITHSNDEYEEDENYNDDGNDHHFKSQHDDSFEGKPTRKSHESFQQDVATDADNSDALSVRSSSPSDFLSDSDLDTPSIDKHNGSTSGSTIRQRIGNVVNQSPQFPSHSHSLSYSRSGYQQQESSFYNTSTTSILNGSQDQHSYDPGIEYSNKLLDYFMSADSDAIPEFLTRPPSSFDTNKPIDEEGHTPFHWACSMGKLKIIEILLNSGANIHVLNKVGQTPLMRSIIFTNCFDKRTFPKVVDILRDSILDIEISHKWTIIHQIALTTDMKSRLPAARYYLEIILGKLTEFCSGPIINGLLNEQDINGDTALHIMSRNGAKKCSKVLINYGAKTDIYNKNKETVEDYLYNDGNCTSNSINRKSQTNTSMLPPSAQSLQLYPRDTMRESKDQLIPGTLTFNLKPEKRTKPRRKYVDTPAAITVDSSFVNRNGNMNNNITTTPNSNQYQPDLPQYFPKPHFSEAAIQATQRIAPLIFDNLETLANLYDDSLKQKEADVLQVQDLLNHLNKEISQVKSEVTQNELQHGSIKLLTEKISKATIKKDELIKDITNKIERNQALSIAKLVEEEEKKITSLEEDKEEEEDSNPNLNSNKKEEKYLEKLKLAIELSKLQLERFKHIQEIINLYSISGGIGEKINNYKKLISISGIKSNNIEDLIDGIEKALVNDVENSQISAITTTDTTTTIQNSNSERGDKTIATCINDKEKGNDSDRDD